MNEALYLQLKDKYLTDQLTEPEFHTFWDQLSRQENQSWLDKFIAEIWGNPVLHQLSNAARKEIILERILARQTLLRRLVSNKWTKIAAAAVVVGIAAGIWMTKDQPAENTSPVVVTKDLDPGKTGATLVLADHSEIKLDSNSAGPVTKQEGASIKAVKGQLQYVPDPGVFELSYNEMHTARGNMFCVQLPDGSKAWLNAASSIRYPTSFPTSTRSVSITGEVHFEVKQDAQRPFFVEANKQAVIEVLGTDFNVKAYDNDSSVTTSLLSGSISFRKIKDSSGAVVLKPGQATLLVKDQLKVTEADTTQVLAWKKGNFYFNNATVQEFMRDLERWYDFETIYPEGIPDIRFSGSMSRKLKLSQILEVIENLGLQSSIENRKVTITKKHH
ncbi:MAG TPA: FecR domain-containing protein [Pseudobacter sp.]|nr:FecR domain-containing protein [Pseudobacter sp.]